MSIASQSGISVCLVTKPSSKPATIKKGIVLIKILSPLMTPRLRSGKEHSITQNQSRATSNDNDRDFKGSMYPDGSNRFP